MFGSVHVCCSDCCSDSAGIVAVVVAVVVAVLFRLNEAIQVSKVARKAEQPLGAELRAPLAMAGKTGKLWTSPRSSRNGKQLVAVTRGSFLGDIIMTHKYYNNYFLTLPCKLPVIFGGIDTLGLGYNLNSASGLGYNLLSQSLPIKQYSHDIIVTCSDNT